MSHLTVPEADRAGWYASDFFTATAGYLQQSFGNQDQYAPCELQALIKGTVFEALLPQGQPQTAAVVAAWSKAA